MSSTFTQDQFNNLVYKKIQSARFTDINLSPTLESPGISARKVLPKDIWNQELPASVPLPSSQDWPNLTTKITTSNYNKYTINNNNGN